MDPNNDIYRYENANLTDDDYEKKARQKARRNEAARIKRLERKAEAEKSKTFRGLETLITSSSPNEQKLATIRELKRKLSLLENDTMYAFENFIVLINKTLNGTEKISAIELQKLYFEWTGLSYKQMQVAHELSLTMELTLPELFKD